QIAVYLSTHALDALTPKTKHFAALRFGRNADFGAAIQRRNFDFATECCRRKADWHVAVKIVFFPLEHRMRTLPNHYVEIAGWAAIDAGFSLAGKTDTVTLVDTCRDFY